MIHKLFNNRPPFVVTPTDKIQYALLWLIRVSMVGAIIWAIFQPDLEAVGITCIVLICTFVPSLFERHYKIALPIEFHLVIIVFIYCTLFLGEVGNAYKRLWWWDMLLHGSSGIVVGFVGFLLLYLPYKQQRLQMSNKLIAFFSFCLGLAAGAIWEMYEFASDSWFHTHMQHSNGDTMHDLATDAIGALVISVAGYQYLKYRHRGIIERLITNFVSLNPQFKKGARK